MILTWYPIRKSCDINFLIRKWSQQNKNMKISNNPQNQNRLERRFTTIKLNQILCYFQPGISQWRYSYDYFAILVGLKQSQNCNMTKGFRKPSPAKGKQAIPGWLNEVKILSTDLTHYRNIPKDDPFLWDCCLLMQLPK